MESEVVKTYFNGAVTQNQLFGMIIALIAVVIILAVAKKIIKVVLSVAVIIGALIYFGVMSPAQIQDISKVVSEQGKGVFEQVATTSQNVKVDTSGDTVSIQICINDNWYNVNDVTSFIESGNGDYTVNINGESLAVSDDSIKKILDMLKK